MIIIILRNILFYHDSLKYHEYHVNNVGIYIRVALLSSNTIVPPKQAIKKPLTSNKRHYQELLKTPRFKKQYISILNGFHQSREVQLNHQL